MEKEEAVQRRSSFHPGTAPSAQIGPRVPARELRVPHNWRTERNGGGRERAECAMVPIYVVLHIRASLRLPAPVSAVHSPAGDTYAHRFPSHRRQKWAYAAPARRPAFPPPHARDSKHITNPSLFLSLLRSSFPPSLSSFPPPLHPSLPLLPP
ncbi:hypothetical protein K488DRAFT_91195 [Vararia minispora EC-137]|uniref:Uncharacterized protein n=1 Tax=Vararia minispora EC-137 TaxID=1314806 RepID=A0ACB8Q6A8_9AGAM|nr:hypothetical protein K488DRAFT_91195 [Vararia minispora EC-137]